MADARATICYMKGLSLHTINEVEKILLNLPQKGDHCEMEVSKPLCGDIGRRTGDVIASKTLEIREEPKPFVLSPPVQKENLVINKRDSKKNVSSCKKNSQFSCMSSTQDIQTTAMEVHTTKTVTKDTSTTKTNGNFKFKVLTDQIRVSPIVECNGVVVELDLEVTIPDRVEKKNLKLEIECPGFVPSRMKIGNKWKNIV